MWKPIIATLLLVSTVALTTAENKPNHNQERPLTADEIILLKLAARPYATINKHEIKRPTDISGGKAKFLVAQFDGRGRRVSLGVALRDALLKIHAGEAKEFASDMAQYPAKMRDLFGTAAGLAIQGKDVPPPFTKEFNTLNASTIKWIDNLRVSATKLKMLEVRVERAILNTANAVEDEFGPAFSTNRLPTDQIHLRPGPFCQSLTIKNVGSETLTNVVLVGRVKADKVVTELEGNQKYADLFNRSLSSEKQADDAEDYIIAENYYGSIPKASVLYLPRLSPGDEVYLDLGYMTRSKDREGKNTATLAVYSDQGRLLATDSRQFTQLPAPERKVGPKPGERTSAPPPTGTKDKLYPGSVWHGNVTVVKYRTRETIEFQVELIVNERTDTALRGDAWYIDRPGPRSPVSAGIKDGQIRMVNNGGILARLPPGRMIGNKLVFAPPPGKAVRDISSAEFIYVPPR